MEGGESHGGLGVGLNWVGGCLDHSQWVEH